MASQAESLAEYLPADILEKYEVHSYRNAAQILATAATKEFSDLRY